MAVKPIEEVLADTLERIADALEELVEVQRTEPLSKIIHPSVLRPKPPKEEEEDDDLCPQCGGAGGFTSPTDNMDIDICPSCNGSGHREKKK